MKVLMLSWEFPPRKVGGLATHVFGLSKAIAGDVEVHIVTCNFPGAPDLEVVNGVIVHRVNVYSAPSPDFLTWTMLMNSSLLRSGSELVAQGGFDLIHCHDWLVGPACVTLKHAAALPLVATIHSTESGRRHGIRTSYQRVIHEIEGWLTYEANRVVCCSWSMVNEVSTLFSTPRDKVWMIPNGVDADLYGPAQPDRALRGVYADPGEDIVLYVGRLVPEKGVNVLIGAVPKILSAHPNAKVVIVGEGYAKEGLKALVRSLGVSHKVYFTGYVGDLEIKKLMQLASVQAIPSIYEPFGIVCLEAMASGTPVVASAAGGLSELVDDGVTGLKVPAENSDALASAVIRLLSDSALREEMSRRAREKAVSDFSWRKIGATTIRMYGSIFA
jgi:glycogen(starch) synthase